MLKTYEGQTEEVLSLPERHIIGSIQINTGLWSLYEFSFTVGILYTVKRLIPIVINKKEISFLITLL